MRLLTLPPAFVARRIHSLLGLGLVVFLIEHLLVNSQALFFFTEGSLEFVYLVNLIHSLPYLQLIEWMLIGVPLLLHCLLGISYLMKGRLSLVVKEGIEPYIPHQSRFKAYVLHRIASIVLALGLVIHVGKFRFIDYPHMLYQAGKQFYALPLTVDDQLFKLARNLKVTLYTKQDIDQLKKAVLPEDKQLQLRGELATFACQANQFTKAEKIKSILQDQQEQKQMIAFLESQQVSASEVIGVSQEFGSITLLSVRQLFKSPVAVAFYTVFVLAACFHAFNGLWTFLLTWGLILKASFQKSMLKMTWALMGLMSALGLMAIWGPYLFG